MASTNAASQLPHTLLPSVDTPRSTPEKVAAYVRTLIFHGHLKSGDRIPQDELSEVLNVSRIPVREAIVALDREGWVTSEPHRGAFANGFSRKGVEDHYELLAMLFGLVAKRSSENATPEDIERLIAQQNALRAAEDPEDIRYQNDNLVRLMFKIADSPRLSAVYRVMTGIVPGNFFAVVPGSIADQKRATARIVKAIAAHDPERAAAEWTKLMHRHAQHVIALLAEHNVLRAN